MCFFQSLTTIKDVKSIRMSIGIIFLAPLMLLPGCSSNSKGRVSKDDLPEQLSLKADRKALEDLRSDVPEEVKIANDEKAYFAELFADPTRQPSKVRETFSRDIRRIRDQFEKSSRKTREAYNSRERKEREAFLDKLRSDREKFSRSKHDQKENARFYSEMDTLRREHFATEREKREEFESLHRQARRDFDDYTRSRQTDFEEQYRNYSRQHAEDQRTKAAAQKQSSYGTPSGPPQSVLSIASGQAGAAAANSYDSGAVASKNPSAPTARALSPEEQAQAERFKRDLQDFNESPAQMKTRLQSGSGGP